MIQRLDGRRATNHVVICGYGTKGRSAIDAVIGRGVESRQIVVIDERPVAIERANADGLAAVSGNAASEDVLRRASGLGGSRIGGPIRPSERRTGGASRSGATTTAEHGKRVGVTVLDEDR